MKFYHPLVLTLSFGLVLPVFAETGRGKSCEAGITEVGAIVNSLDNWLQRALQLSALAPRDVARIYFGSQHASGDATFANAFHSALRVVAMHPLSPAIISLRHDGFQIRESEQDFVDTHPGKVGELSAELRVALRELAFARFNLSMADGDDILRAAAEGMDPDHALYLRVREAFSPLVYRRGHHSGFFLNERLLTSGDEVVLRVGSKPPERYRVQVDTQEQSNPYLPGRPPAVGVNEHLITIDKQIVFIPMADVSLPQQTFQEPDRFEKLRNPNVLTLATPLVPKAIHPEVGP